MLPTGRIACQFQAEAGLADSSSSALPFCPQVANHVVQALLNQKVKGHKRLSHPLP